MGRKRSSGFLETIVKSAFGVGTTVHYESDWLGRKQKIVKHHDTGKTKTYTHGCGFWGNTTKTKTTIHGHVHEEGKVKPNLLWGATEHAQRSDGSSVTRKYSPGFFRDHVTTHVDGICFKCNGTGQKTLPCRLCAGSGVVHLSAKSCNRCNGSGKINGAACRKCAGSGQYMPAKDAQCRKCNGSGTFSVTCNKCGGSGTYSRTTRD